MPQNPIEFLKRLGSAATTPLVSEEAIEPYQEMIDSPELERGPMEARMRGFGAGALEGLRGLTSPLDMAGMAMPAMGAGMRAMRGAKGMMKAAGPTMDLIEPQVVKQVAPAMDDVDALIGDMHRNMAKIPSKQAPRMETLGEVDPRYTPKGGEGLYNVGKQPNAATAAPDMSVELLRRLGGRGR